MELKTAQNTVERINYRMEKLIDNLGVNNPIVQDFMNQIDFWFPENTHFYGEYIRISRPSDIIKSLELTLSLEKLDVIIPTWKIVKETFETDYKETKEKTDFPEDVGSLQTYIQVVTGLPYVLKNYYQQVNDNDIMHIMGRRKTYDELLTVINSCIY